MNTQEFHAELARLAHALWCDRMRAEGWRYGPEYDEAARTHDALVAFERLGKHDLALARRKVSILGLAHELEDAVEYPRGPDRQFVPEEMRVGMPVGWSQAFRDPEETGDPRGKIESWQADAEGELELVRVRWPDGELVEYYPSMRELRRV